MSKADKIPPTPPSVVAQITSTLSYFRLPPEASSQGVLSSSVSFMNDAGNTIWRWLRSW